MENNIRSFSQVITSALIEAKDAHHLAVQLGQENDDNWPVFYGNWIARRIAPVITGMQSAPVANVKGTIRVDGRVLAPLVPVRWEVDPDTHMEYPVEVGR
jgi:hypothetical protein